MVRGFGAEAMSRGLLGGVAEPSGRSGRIVAAAVIRLIAATNQQRARRTMGALMGKRALECAGPTRFWGVFLGAESVGKPDPFLGVFPGAESVGKLIRAPRGSAEVRRGQSVAVALGVN